MKKLFLSMVALMMATLSYAQDVLVATLNHEDNITMYYGIYAFSSAHNAAVSGDIITLSGGAFKGDFTITKAVTVRGTGIDAPNSTCISSKLEINIPESDTNRFSVEGVRFDDQTVLYGSFSNPCFLKCQFYSVLFENSSSKYSYIKDALFVNCKITGYLHLYGANTALFSHCYIYAYSSDFGSSKAQFCNCVLYGSFDKYNRSSFVNCILCYTGNCDPLPSECSAMNCTAIYRYHYDYYAVGGAHFSADEYKYNVYTNMQGNQVSCSSSTYEAMFKGFGEEPRNAYKFFESSNTFELTDEAKTKFLGTDGTEVGLYGGKYPYDSTPAYPHITKFNVAKQATADDKLSVEIEVSATE